MQDQIFCFPLLSLPQLPLSAVAKCLEGKDRRSLAFASRSLAALVSAAASDPCLTVRPSTSWKGLCKVLATGIVTCRTLRLTDDETCKRQPADDNALEILLQAAGPLGYCFPRIQKLYIRTCALPCLLSVRLASLLPNLEKLEILCSSEQFADDDSLQPIAFCRSLRKIKYVGTLQLPDKYHTTEDLRTQLPNVVSLTLRPSAQRPNRRDHDVCRTMVDAWGTQLTKVHLKTREFVVQQAGRNALSRSVMMLPSSLTSLKVDNNITELQLEIVLQLSLLRKFWVMGFKNTLFRDWSKHPCSWERLSIWRLQMVDLSKLPLHSLNGRGCIHTRVLQLPDPLLGDSICDVVNAAQCVSNANTTIDCVYNWECKVWEQHHVSALSASSVDAASASLLQAACRVVEPRGCYHLEETFVPNYPQTTTTVVNWLSAELREFTCRVNFTEPQVWLWQALQCCSKLNKLRIVHDRVTGSYVDGVTSLVMEAAEHLVAQTRRPIVLAFDAWSSGLSFEKMQSAIASIGNKLPYVLPASVVLQKCCWEWVHWNGDVVINLQPRTKELFTEKQRKT